MIKQFVAFSLLLLVLTACSDNTTAISESGDAAIRNLIANYDETATNEDLDGWLELLTEDVYWGAPKQTALIGRQAVLGRVGTMFSDFDVTSSSTIGEVRIADGWGIVSGTYDFLIEPNAGGDPYHELGKMIYVVERGADGRWRIAKGIWNSNDEDAI